MADSRYNFDELAGDLRAMDVRLARFEAGLNAGAVCGRSGAIPAGIDLGPFQGGGASVAGRLGVRKRGIAT
jgi:hypothetical protein